MSKNRYQDILGVQVDASMYLSQAYCSPDRFASFFYQMKEILDCGAKSVLEIGPGNGVVNYLLQRAGINVDTLDHNPDLLPNYVASVLNMPFQTNSYDAVLCCEVLEHLPWKMFLPAIMEITKVARKYVIISLPHTSRYYYIEFQLPKTGKRKLSIDIPTNRPMQFDGEHYWEIGKGVKLIEVKDAFLKSGLKILREYRVIKNLYHHYFVLTK